MNSPRWTGALIFVFILLASSFWPIAVMAQENNTAGEGDSNSELPATTTMCALSGLEVINLDRDEAVAIQGIVTQDVATSAERYREQQAAEKFGLNNTQKTESQKRLEKYNLYFMGPDGIVYYSPVLNDRMRSNNEWLIGTSIDGRVEYGGEMGEDLAICPELPINETSEGICTKRNGEKTDDFNIKPGGYTTGFINKTAETVGSNWITAINSLSLHSDAGAWGYVSLNPSRLKASKWTTTMAVFPAGGSVFVIPRTYMYFTTRMKSLAWFDGATQFVFMAYAFGSLLKPAVSKIFKRDSLFLKQTARANENARKLFLDSDTDIITLQKHLDNMDDEVKALLRSKELKRSSVLNKLDDLIRHTDDADDIFSNKLAKVINDMTGEGDLVKETEFTNKLTMALEGKDMQSAKSVLHGFGFTDDAVDKVIKSYEILPSGSFSITGTDVLSKLEVHNTYDLMKHTRSYELFGKCKKVGLIKEGKVAEIMDPQDLRAISSYYDALRDEEKLLKAAHRAASAEDTVSFRTALSELSTMKKEPTNEIFRMVRTGYQSKPVDNLPRYTRWFTKEREFFGASWIGRKGRILSSGTESTKVTNPLVIRALRLPQKSLFAFVQGLYFIARPITLIAYGLHLTGLLFEKQGYLTLTAPGLSFHWDPSETGALLTPKSYIILIGVPKSISAFYGSGFGGYIVGKTLRDFLVSSGLNSVVATKYSELGQNLLFGGIMYEHYPGIIEVQRAKPKGITKIEPTSNGYLMRLRDWENQVMVMVEDPASMDIANGKATTALGMRTSDIDVYQHILGNPGEVKNVFPFSWSMSEKLRDWGTQTSLIGVSSIVYLWPAIPVTKYAIAPLILGLAGKAISGGTKTFLTTKLTSMKDLEKCYSQTNYTGGGLDCVKRPPCEAVEASCEAKIGMMSIWLGTSGIIQSITQNSMVLTPLNIGLGLVDYVVLAGPGKIKGKMEVTSECMQDLLTCSERSFMVVGGSQYEDPSVLKAEEEQSKQLKGLPGLENLPLNDFLEGFSKDKNDSMLKPAQMQMNIHSEMENATGRVAFKRIYYVHLKDAKIDWLTSNLPIHLCPMEGNDVNDSLCVTINNRNLIVGNRTIVSDDLVPFRWMDETLPAMVIPNTAVVVNMNETTDCPIFISDPSGKVVSFNPMVIAKFSGEHFDELARSMGPLRDIETDKGAIYPNMDYNGHYRWEMDYVDGSFKYSAEKLTVTGMGNVKFNNESFAFKSAVFEGGVIIKKGDRIYIVPKYFKPPMTAMDWLRATKGQPLVSDTGAPLEVNDEYGRLIGINGSNTRIPGGDKLGIITRVDASKDLNGNGKIDANETAGFRFYTGKDNRTKMDLWYDGKRETYDGSQIEIDEDTGCIKIYEEGKEHIQANLLREVCLKTLPNGATEIHIHDGNGKQLTEPRIVDWIRGTGGAIKYDPNTNNYVFVNGQPIQLNNDFSKVGFNPITGRTEPPLLQPSAVDTGLTNYPNLNGTGGIKVPIRPADWTVVIYALALVGGIFLARVYSKKKKRETP
ncbi:MAG: hypothetical protein J7L23_03220 [Candidatus Diapherotrites archaeon]|nr:hypothetical protein [Candidatus Diapherotrites archaeon]